MSAAAASVVALVGLRCSGKSSVARELARRLGLARVDLDDEVLALAHARASRRERWAEIGELLAHVGEPAFRALEHDALLLVLERGTSLVLATGGGVVERADNRRVLRERARCVWLRAGISVLQARLRADPRKRPALLGGDPAAELPELARRREPLYAEVASVRIECGSDAPAEIARRIELELGPAAGA